MWRGGGDISTLNGWCVKTSRSKRTGKGSQTTRATHVTGRGEETRCCSINPQVSYFPSCLLAWDPLARITQSDSVRGTLQKALTSDFSLCSISLSWFSAHHYSPWLCHRLYLLLHVYSHSLPLPCDQKSYLSKATQFLEGSCLNSEHELLPFRTWACSLRWTTSHSPIFQPYQTTGHYQCMTFPWSTFVLLLFGR